MNITTLSMKLLVPNVNGADVVAFLKSPKRFQTEVNFICYTYADTIAKFSVTNFY